MENHAPPSDQDRPTTPTPPAIFDGPKPIDFAARAREAAAFCTPERLAIEAARAAEERAREFSKRCGDCWQGLKLGRRYVGCRLENFDTADDRRKIQAVDTIAGLLPVLAEHVERGGNVIFYGPVGTGKDHLCAALLHHATARLGISAQWINGQDLFGSFRDAIDSDRSESSTVGRYASRAILAISDPTPPKGDVRQYGAEMLYRVIDARYREMLGTWVTINAISRDEARGVLTAPVFDRLLDGAFTIFCNWSSHRTTLAERTK